MVTYSRLRLICACSSYAFPHRPGGGRCICDDSDLCAGCGQPAETTEVDFGIGAYEYWGQRCVDANVQTVSVCCEASFVPNTWSEHLKHNWEVIK